MATTNSSTDPNPTEKSDQPWQSIKLESNLKIEEDAEYDFPLLKDNKSSILGDICITLRDNEYTLDRVMLVSKSNYFKDLILSKKENTIGNEINSIIPKDTSLDHFILDVMYGRNVECVLNEDNFVKILDYMRIFEMEINLDIFERFIEDFIKPRPQLNIRMFELLDFIFRNSPHFDFLLKVVSEYFTHRLLTIYKEKEFLNLTAEGFLSIISWFRAFNEFEKQWIGCVCAEWICHDYQNRIKSLKDLVNAAKYRYSILPYCDWDSNLMVESFRINHQSSEPKIQQVENYFNELLYYFGEAKFDIPSELREKIKTRQSARIIVFPTDQAVHWVSLLENETFSDIAINVQGSTFKLHRIKLSSVSGYFYDLFTNPSELLAFDVDKSNEELKIYNHALDQIDPETFRSIVQYIYRQEIEVTSKNHLINLLKASRFLKMNELFEKSGKAVLENINCYSSAVVFEIFQYFCDNGKCSELLFYFPRAVEKIINLWPKLDDIPQFFDISLDTLTEIVTISRLKINNTDEVLDLCSKWIFHDIQNRYQYIIKVARAINRNFAMNIQQLELEIPQSFTDYSQLQVKQQLIRILSSTALVPEKPKNFHKDEQKPCFLTSPENNSLRVLDASFKEIFQLKEVCYTAYGFKSSATLIDDQLFILFQKENNYYYYNFFFQLYDISSKKIILLAADERMTKSNNFEIFCCNNEVYFCNGNIILKYSAQLNRWISFLKDDEQGDKQYTSDGKKFYKIFSIYNEKILEWENKTSYYDFEKNEWIALPNIPIKTESVAKGKVNIIKGELGVLLKSKTLLFSWITQKWTEVSNRDGNFVEFTSDGQNILYVSDSNEIYSYSPVRNEWILERKLDIVGSVKTIHKIDK